MRENAVLMLTRNCLELTKKCVDSIYKQDIPVYLLVIDNASGDDTFDWLQSNQIHTVKNETNEGVSASWNWGLNVLFENAGYDHILVPNNDTVLASWTYRMLLEYEKPFVTGIAVDDPSQIETPPQAMPLDPHPDFSLFCMRYPAWKAVGKFNERLVHYCSDTDWHVRAHRMGIPLWKANVPYLHFRSSTLNNADPQDRAVIQAQAEADRGTFRAMYGCIPGDSEYEKLFLPVEA
jgi:GT2 family glycosyltransferase